MSSDFFNICNLSVPPGGRMRQEVPVAQLFDQTKMTIPLEVMRGKEDGPVLLVSAAMHGDEINGCEAIKRILNHPRLISKLKGTLVTVPIINVFGYNRNSRYLPDRRDLNRCFPGSPQGSLAARLAHILLNEIALKCTHVIDLHTGAINRCNYPQVRATLEQPHVEDLAKSFNVPLVLNSSLRPNSFRMELNKSNIPNIVFEGGEALRYEEPVIEAAINGVFNAMISLGMIKGDMQVNQLKEPPYIAHSSVWMRAPKGGSLRLMRNLGEKVQKDDIVGIVSDAYGRNKAYIRSLHEGVIIGISRLPLVMDGDAVVHLALFEKPLEIEREMELLDEEMDIYNL